MWQKGGFYTITRDDQLSSWTKKKFQSTFQSQTCTKRGYGHCLLVCCWSDPLQLSESQVKPSQLRSMLGRLIRCSKICNACSWHWSTERAHFFSMTIPNPTLHNQHFKSWTNWPTKCCLILHICLISYYHFFKHPGNLLQGKHFHNQQEADNAFQECWIPKYGLQCRENKQAYFVGKNVLTVMAPIWINKAVFEPSCNDLKFPVQNSNYFYTNLIYTANGN